MTVHYEQRGHIGLITIDRPERRGAMDSDAYSQLAAAWREALSTDSVRVAVVTGVDDSYCAGADLREYIPAVTKAARDGSSARAHAGHDAPMPDGRFAILRNVDFRKPIVAAVNGPCVASGMEMLLGTDIRLASPNAVFGLPEVCRGLFASGGSTVRLPRQIPFVHAMDILLTGRHLCAQEALDVGLINRIVPQGQLLEEALRVAEMIAMNSPTAVSATKQSVMRGLALPLVDAYAMETQFGQTVFASADAIEGPRAFLEKRSPQWRTEEVS